jgi:hypothetical protein
MRMGKCPFHPAKPRQLWRRLSRSTLVRSLLLTKVVRPQHAQHLVRLLLPDGRCCTCTAFLFRFRAGAKFENGVNIERPDEPAGGDTHAA